RRRPLGSAVSPYTTLFRSHELVDGPVGGLVRGKHGGVVERGVDAVGMRRTAANEGSGGRLTRSECPRVVHDLEHVRAVLVGESRSEEHTSELQSRENLVCR